MAEGWNPVTMQASDPIFASPIRLRKAHGGDRSGVWRKWLDSKMSPTLGEREWEEESGRKAVSTGTPGSRGGAGCPS